MKLLRSPLFALVVAVLLSPVIIGSAATQKVTDLGRPEATDYRPVPKGADSIGVFMSPPTWMLSYSNAPGPADMTFYYGPADAHQWIPLAGDWDANGMDSPGLFDPQTSSFFLKNACAPGDADYTFSFGDPKMYWVMPIVGDWNGDGYDTIGIYDGTTGTFYLRDDNTPGPANNVFVFGAPDEAFTPVVGDWDGDNVDTIGLYHSTTGTFFLRNSNSVGTADLAFNFGPVLTGHGRAWMPIAGDWDGDWQDTIGLYDPSTSVFFLRHKNASGPADVA
jgi:hypothetical protein